ncbi:MAG: Ldh family oxidoreductase [Bacteroidales bacterium]|nr:Ldh family oxidoreductase [Bacteroidales bacterium]
MIYFDPEKTREIMCRILKENGVNAESITHVTDSIIDASLKGIDTHGLALFPHYLEGFQLGRINKKPQFKIVKNNGSAKLIDADGAIGHHAGRFAMDFCIDMAAKSGTGCCAVKNSSHFGAAEYFTIYAAKHNMLGFAFTNTNSLVKAYNAVDPIFGTNPICFACPIEGEEPLSLDMATSVISWNQVRNCKEAGIELKDGCAYDENGKFTTNPNKAKCVRPIGDYKGFGLGMMVEILCSVLSGSEMGKDLMPMFHSDMTKKRGISHFFQAIDISKFTNANNFIKRMGEMVKFIRNMRPLEGQEVMVPGDPEKRRKIERLNSGIPMMQNVYNEFINISKDFENAVK